MIYTSTRMLIIVAVGFVLASCLSGGGGGGNDGVAGGGGISGPTCTSVSYAAPSGAVNNIVFTFDKPYSCGQFANGDWWVSKDSNAFVTITSITPTASGGINGYEVNPSNTMKQAFDIRAQIEYLSTLMPNLPLNLTGVSSVVKAVSVPGLAGSSESQLRFAAVLTIVDSPVSNSEEVFRPAYFGTTKTFYNTSQIRVSDLPKYNASALPSASAFTISSVASRYSQVQLDHYSRYNGLSLYPRDNLPDYGATIATNSATSLARLLLDDFDYSNPVHKRALINYLQMSIDLQAMAAGGVVWPANGGHGNGRKLPLIFAEWAFSNPNFRNAITASSFSEDTQVLRSPVTGKALFGWRVSNFSDWETFYWQTIISDGATGARDMSDPYRYIDGGGQWIGGQYQSCCTSKPWQYTVLALYMLGLENAWDSDRALIDYIERWVGLATSGAIALPDPCAPYDGIPANYGVTFGPDGAGGCKLGTGRYPGKHRYKDSEFYDNQFGEDLWGWYKANFP